MADEEEVKDLEIMSIIGFDGNIPDGLHCHPDGVHIIYPIGNSVTIQNTLTKQQEFLNGHTNTITALSLSKSGKYIASGQINHMGFKSTVILWDFERRCLINKHEIHKVRVERICFTCDDSFLISLGGRDDCCVVVYDIEHDEPLCGGYASGSSTGNATILCETNRRGVCFLTGGDKTLRYWKIDRKRRKTFPNEVNFNKVKRLILCMVIDDKDEFLYCGTSTGDIAKVVLGYPEDLNEVDPKRPPTYITCLGKAAERNVNGKNGKNGKNGGSGVECYSQGVTALIWLAPGELMLGTGDGLIEQVREKDADRICMPIPTSTKLRDPTSPSLKGLRCHKVGSGVSSLKLWGNILMVGTVLCEIYSICLKRWTITLKSTCHTSAIYDVCFPSDFSAVFATCSKDTIRVWNTETSQEMLKIQVPNFTCSGICFYYNGKGIVSSWNDGTIRGYTPQTGKLMYIIHNAHNKGVSALNITKDGLKIVSGGGEGQVRVWDIKPDVQRLRAVLQEHKGPVSALHVNNANDEAASASTDGSCIIWDIIRCVRKNIIFSNTLFMAVRYHPSDCQILTTGTNRKISYWEIFDGSLIRELEGSSASGVNTLDISSDGQFIVSGGNDQMVKFWKYQEGITTHIGLGHAGIITRAKFSPDNKYIITVSADGGIYRWKNPYSSPESQDEKKEKEDVVSIHSEPSESKMAKGKDLEESVAKTVTVSCKCGSPNCKCPKMQVTTAKIPQGEKPRCNYTLTVARPAPKKTQSRSDARRTIHVASSEIGKNNIYGDYCPRSEKKQ